MTAYLIISPYGSLNFNDDWRQRDQQSVDYTQKFIAGDTVTVQYAVPRGNDQSWSALDIRHYNLDTGESIPVTSTQVDQTDAYTFYNATIDTSAAGCYGVAFELTDSEGNVTVVKESVFQVLADYPTEDEDQLMLFRYNNDEQKDNTIFASDFYFRCEATFFPQNETYEVEDNNFRDQAFDLSKLSAEASTTRGLTVGGKLGVPSWVAEKLSKIFSCTEVYLGEVDNQVEYVMADGGGFERTNMGEMYPRYMFTINLERTVAAANAVRIGVITPVGESVFEIDPVWLDFTADANIGDIFVTAPDRNWSAVAEDQSWLTVTKYLSAVGVSLVLNSNSTGADRSQAVTFTRTDPDTGAVLTRVATVNQAAEGEGLELIKISGRVFFPAEWGSLDAANVSIEADGVALTTEILASNGELYYYWWSVSQEQYEATNTLVSINGGGKYTTELSTLTPLPSFEDAIQNGITFPDVILSKL